MATYFHENSEFQGSGDGLQTLIFMNPTYVGFSDNQPPQQPAISGNFVFLNYNPSANTLHQLPHAPPPQTQHFVNIPFHGGATTPANQHDVSGFLPHVQQGLSLSLSSQQPPAGSISPVSGVSNGGNGVQNVTLSSKYLRAAQELLDEVVKVGKAGKKSTSELPVGEQRKTHGKSAAATTAAAAVVSGEEGSGKRGAELSTAERQHIQMKKAKLVNMLDEVEQRYRQYHQQMQTVISLFEQASGIGSATSYTALALQTISKQFRCLKDAILAQIRASGKSLGEEDGFEGKTEVSGMKYVDNQIRQQRALQQLGMIQHNAWRPQRGLPERSVSVLRAWLFEHFLHPYPKDSDKHMLAKHTGLTRNQVSNWFINARVRLWKPMVEEMYVEESKEQGKHGSGSKTEQNQEDSASKSDAPQAKNTAIINQNQGLTSKQEINHHPINHTTGFKSNPGFFLIGSSSEKPRNADNLHSLGTLPSNFSEGFGSYQIGELGMFGDDQVHAPYSGNGVVSLSLGLPHSHRNFVPNQSIQQLGRGVEIGESNDFSSINSTPNSYTLNHCV